MFSNIEQVHIGVGHFTQNIINRDYNTLKSLPRSRDAAFSAAIDLDNLSRRRCTEGTRLDIIAQIVAWVKENDPAKAPPVYWLTGLAGLGKTTIAFTICELLDDAHIPFTSFFCSLQLDSRNSRLLVTTLCRDLAELYSSYAASVVSVLETNSKVVNAGLRIQIDQLLAKPWQASIAPRQDHNLPIPIVIVDALDESDRGSEFLEELLRVIQANQLTGIKFLVTSRLDPKIVKLCKSFPPNAVCKLHEVDTANVQNDIEKYLREALPELKDEPELALLSQRAGGLFIYATTAVRFISPLHTPRSVSEMRSHLQSMLKPGASISHADSDDRSLVDELYQRILGVAFRDAWVRATRLRILHTIICAESRVDTPVLAELTNTDQGTVQKVVESLHPVLFVSPRDGCVYWYHASFPDFLFSQVRARISLSLHQNHRTLEFDVFCDQPAHHGVLSQQCLSLIHKSLHFNMCNLPSSYIFDSDVPGLNASVDTAFSPTFRYVSRQWARHLIRAVAESDDLLYGLKDFLENKLLFWIEAMNLIGAKTECFSLLKDAECWLERGTKLPDLLGQLDDAMNFSAFFAGSPSSESTPHLYVSALSMWNQDSTIWRNWKDQFRFIPLISLSSGAITIPLLTIPTTGFVNCIAFSPDGNQIVSGSYEVWNAKTGKLLKVLKGGIWHATSVTFSPDGNQIISSSRTEWGRWDVKTGELLGTMQQLTGNVTSVGFSPDGNRIAFGSRDEPVRVWDVKTGGQLSELQGHTDLVTSVAFSPDGSRIVSGSEDKSVRVWDAKTGKQLSELRGHTNTVTSVAFSPDGNRIVSGSEDKSARVWDAKTAEQLNKLPANIVTSVAFSPDGNRIVTGSSDKSVCVWDAKTGEQLSKLQGHTDTVTSAAFLPDGNRIISCSWDKSVRVWAAKTGKRPRELQGHTNTITSVAFSLNRIASGSEDKSVRVWDAKTGEQLSELRGHTDTVTSVAFSPDGNRIVSGSEDKSARVWDAKTGEQLATMLERRAVLTWLSILERPTRHFTPVAFSPDGNRIISSSGDRLLRSVLVWDVETGKQLNKLQGHSNTVTSVAFSPDGNRIVSGSEDRSVRVWDAKTGEQLSVKKYVWKVTSVTFSPDGNRILFGSGESVQEWDAKADKQLRYLRMPQVPTKNVTSVTFSPDGDRIISSSGNSVWVWGPKTGEQPRELQGHTDMVNSVAFSRDGNRIVSGSSDRSVRVWANLDLDAPWAMEEDGWITSGADLKMLVWIPSTIRSVLLRPHNTLILSRNGSATISFTQCKLGASWHQCYTP